MPLDAFEPGQPVGGPVLADGRVAQVAADEGIAVDAQHAIGGRHPEPPVAILGQAKNRHAQLGGHAGKRADVSGIEHGEATRRAGPDAALRVLEQHVDVVRGQAVASGVPAPVSA